MFSFEHRHHAFVPILCGFPSPEDKTRTLPARDLLISKAASSACASFSGAQRQHPNVPGLRVDALLAHSAPSAPAVTSFEHERRHAPAAKGARYSEADGRRRAARRSARILGRPQEGIWADRLKHMRAQPGAARNQAAPDPSAPAPFALASTAPRCSERHSIGRRQRKQFGPERNRWTRRQGRHQSRLRDTRASGGVRLPKKDGRRTEWNRP